MNRVGARQLLAFGGWHLSLALGAVGCLVTEQPNWDEENVPANVSAEVPTVLLTRVASLPDNLCNPSYPPDPTLVPNDEEPWTRFVVRVYDANVEDELTGRVLINGSLNTRSSRTIPITGRRDRDPVTLCLRYGDLNKPCNHVEFLVSKAFTDNPTLYDTKDPDDFAKVEWLVLGPNQDVTEDACAQALNEGGP